MSILRLDIVGVRDYKKYIMSWMAGLDGDGNVQVTIAGYLDDTEGREAVDAVVSLLLTNPGQPRDLVFEVGSATGYRRNVRLAWQAALMPQRNQIRRIVVVEGSSVVRMSLNVMAMFLGVPVALREGASTPLEVEPDAPVRRRQSRSSSRTMTRPLSGPVLGPAVPMNPPKRERSWASLLLRRHREESRPNF